MPTKRARKKPEPEEKDDSKAPEEGEPPTKKKRGQKVNKDDKPTEEPPALSSSEEASGKAKRQTTRSKKATKEDKEEKEKSTETTTANGAEDANVESSSSSRKGKGQTARSKKGTKEEQSETVEEKEEGEKEESNGKGTTDDTKNKQPPRITRQTNKRETTTATKNAPTRETESSNKSIKNDSKSMAAVADTKKTRNKKNTEMASKSKQPAAKKAKATTKKHKKDDNSDEVTINSGIESKVSHPSHKTAAGTILVLGMGELGQLGLGEDVTERKRPFPVKGALENCVIQVECGGVHTVALTNKGQIYTWGCNDEGALGRSIDTIDEYTPGLVDKLQKAKIVQVSAGDSHTAALTENGSVYCWGIFRDSDGPFGLIDSTPSLEPQIMYSSTFNKAIKIVSGSDHVAMLTEQGDIYTFGCGENGQLGRVSECFSTRGGRRGIGLLLVPAMVRFRTSGKRLTKSFRDVYAGENTTFAVGKEEKEVYVWGLNHRGQLGTGDERTRFIPERVPKDWLWSWAKSSTSSSESSSNSTLMIAGGSSHSVVCDNDQNVYVMGANEYGQLGLSQNITQVNAPTEVKGVNAVQVSCGSRCSFAVTKEGSALSWGIGSNYQLGCCKDDEDIFVPTPMEGENLENCKVLDTSSGGQHTALLVSMDTN